MSLNPDPVPARGRSLRPFVWGAAACLLLVPAIAMRLQAPGVHWTPSDFAAMALMMAVACTLYELAVRSSSRPAARAGFALAVATAFLTAWVNLAVGMFGSEGDPRNLMFVGVLLVAAAGTLRAGLRPRGMQSAMVATALAQLVAALAGGVAGAAGNAGPGGAAQAMEAVLVGGFALPWLAAAWLFRRADAGRHLVPS